MGIRIVRRGAFGCVGSDGNTYIVKRSVRIHKQTHRGRTWDLIGAIELRCNSQLVNRIEKGHYRTDAGVELSSADANAP
jgi:hypothetical protein